GGHLLLLARGSQSLPGGGGGGEADAPAVRAAPADPRGPPGRARRPGRGPRPDDGEGPGRPLPDAGRGPPRARPLGRGPRPAPARRPRPEEMPGAPRAGALLPAPGAGAGEAALDWPALPDEPASALTPLRRHAAGATPSPGSQPPTVPFPVGSGETLASAVTH